MESILKQYTKAQIDRAKNIRALIFDVDGVLTDGKITYTEGGDEIKSFNVKDGQIIRHLRLNNFVVGAITGRSSKIVARRCAELKLDFVYQGTETKKAKLSEIRQKYGLKDDEIAYIGDDIIDLSLIKEVGLGMAPIDALEYVKAEADLVIEKRGGDGVVREAADFILAAQGKLDSILNSYY
ncbi:3-deoxy-manno-octulosonate-8-phosphatase [Fulvivirga sp. RKSG066]|uniref:KdsC family phosphatase n=1 Tax=Fulvivirga aurantia TaxID=2529383 RepID=UPI0012BCDF52|nr:HAD hydrolase family protein [Fulvivirga aurantia]MTI21020.1 3-deoxy-manno-octulosonate-8-phosphatase [Fulvivirga aurantia]